MGEADEGGAGRLCLLEALVVVLFLLALANWACPGWHTGRSRYAISRTQKMRGADGLLYQVHSAHSNPAAAVDQLARLQARTIALLDWLDRRYLRNPRAAARWPQRAAIVRRLLDRYDPDKLAESSPHNPTGDTSYTLDKGRLVALCLRQKRPDSDGLHDATLLWFVKVHELAHIGLDETGHPPVFWETFKFLLHECADAGLVPSGRWPDYAQNPVDYCGLHVDYSPFYSPIPMPR